MALQVPNVLLVLCVFIAAAPKGTLCAKGAMAPLAKGLIATGAYCSNRACWHLMLLVALIFKGVVVAAFSCYGL